MKSVTKISALLFLSGGMISLAAAADKSAAPTAADKPRENSLGMKFVPVKGTEVQFCIWQTRVQDFQAFVKATGYDATTGMLSLGNKDGEWKAKGDSWEAPAEFNQTSTNPVVGVSWNDAKAFCQWLTKKEQKEGKLSANQSYRLPTDAEWSVAVGLGEETGATPDEKDKNPKNKNIFPWGRKFPPPPGTGNYGGEESNIGSLAWRKQVIEGYNDGFPRTSPVGSFPANQSGLYDMGGNVTEWCEDHFNAMEPTSRVLRGASWLKVHAPHFFSSSRGRNSPDIRRYDTGFRCVLAGGEAPH